MPSNEEEDQNMYEGEEEEDLDGEGSEEEDEDEEEEELITHNQPEDEEEEEEEEENLNSDSPSTSSDDPNKYSSTLPVGTPPTTTTATTTTTTTTVATAIETPPTVTDHKRQRTIEPTEEKKPSAFDDSRRLFQRLWTDEDEIGLLQGFLDYTTQRGSQNSSHHHDTAPFYDQIKTRLQLDFNKNQLVEKLRRLKKKYRNVVTRISSGKEFSFKSAHDQATFEISRKIWSSSVTGGGGVEEAGIEDDEVNPTNGEINYGANVNNSGKKVPRSRKRSRIRAAEDNISNPSTYQVNSSIPNVIEDTVKSCLSPLFKELLYCAINGPCNSGGLGGVALGGLGGMALNPVPLNFGGNSLMNFSRGEVIDEKWRKQQILELEVYSKRIELVQDQIKSALEELRSMDS